MTDPDNGVLPFTLADHRFLLRRPDLIDGLESFLEPLRLDESHGQSFLRSFSIEESSSVFELWDCEASKLLFEIDNPADFLLSFDRILIDTYLEFLPSTIVVVHAAVLETPRRLLVFHGPSGAGKTTLAEQLILKTDWSFLCDELFAVEPNQGRVYPFPHPLNFKTTEEVQMERTLTLTDSAGKTFRYGLPSRERVRRTSQSLKPLVLFEIERRESAPYERVSRKKSRGLQRLFEDTNYPENSRQRFRRLMTLSSLELDCYRLNYGDFRGIPPETLIP